MPRASLAATETLTQLQSASQATIETQVSPATGNFSFVRAPGGAVLHADKTSATPQARALAFLAMHGALMGISDAERAALSAGGSPTAGSDLQIVRTEPDAIGMTHVKLDQFYKGLQVFGAQLVVHMNDRGITAVNGHYVPDISLSTIPAITKVVAGEKAVTILRKTTGGADLRVNKNELSIYPMGLLEGFKVRSVLAYKVEVAGPQTNEQVWLNAQSGATIIRIPLRHDVLHRIVYSPSYDPNNPNNNIVVEEGDPAPPPPASPHHNLYHYTGHTYNLYRSAFGRDSYDGIGSEPQRTVLLASEACPNAYWNGETTNYCPDFDKDDIVAHEWAHAYTQHTHNLIYAYQSGALNESYSDFFGEAIDLHNAVDGTGGINNSQPTTYVENPPGSGTYVVTPPDPANGTRWRVGEDVQGLSQPAALGILRDMWFPPAFADPDKVSSPLYHCAASDGGGVHTNSGVSNHTFAMLVDGKTFNGQTIIGIGFTRALHIYYRAMTFYQVSSTNFPQHAQAIQQSCRDLIGQPLNNFSTSTATPIPAISPDVIAQTHCEQVDKAVMATEMDLPPTQCNFQKLLDPNTPAECSGSSTFFNEDWETGMDGWTVANQGTGDAWPGTNWTLDSSLPENLDGSAHSGTAAFAINPQIGEPNGGTCQPGGDVSGHFWIDSPTITIPAGASDPKLAFEHFVQTEVEFDGGNVKISVNGGPFNVVPDDQYVFNPPNFTAPTGMPLAGERIWNGANGGELNGSWGTTIINLANLTNPGDTIKVRFDFGQDGCNGNLGWFVDTVRVYNCPVLDPPVLSIGADYEDPDTNGSYTLNWTRPTGATGPDTLQESTSCGPVFTDDASETLVAGSNSNWEGSPQWSSQPNPSDNSTAYYIPDGAAQDESLTMVDAIPIPAGASATLTFTTTQGLEDGFDFGHVEVSTDGGANFLGVASYTGPEGATLPTDVFEGTRTINLSQFAGQSIKLRFRVTSDAFNIGQQAGWYIDNIAITATAFSDVTTTSGTSHLISGKPSGNYCYRVRTAYDVGGQLAQGPFSNVVGVEVAQGPLPSTAVSRKMHGTFEGNIPLPLTGNPGIECRRGPVAGEHQMVITFPGSVTVGDAKVTSGTGSVTTFTPSGSVITVNLTGITNAQTIVVTLFSVNNAGNVSIPMGVLLGDSSADGVVDSADITQTRRQSGQVTTSSNFRTDMSIDGVVNSADITLVRRASGTAVPE